MTTNTLSKFARHRISVFVTPFIERLVHGLVYPAVLGASLVEATIKIRDFYASLPWVLVLALFMLDYALTGAETSAKPPKGNVLTAIADLLAAAAFVGTYVVSAAWDGKASFSDTQIRHLVVVIFGLHIANLCWYFFRWCTQNLTEIAADRTEIYRNLLKTNFIVFGVQSAIVGALGTIVLLGCIGARLSFYVIILLVYAGLLYRNWNEYRRGPWA